MSNMIQEKCLRFVLSTIVGLDEESRLIAALTRGLWSVPVDIHDDLDTTIHEKSKSISQIIFDNKIDSSELIAVFIDPFYEPLEELYHLNSIELHSRDLCTTYVFGRVRDLYNRKTDINIDFAKCRSFNAQVALLSENSLNAFIESERSLSDLYNMMKYLFVMAFDETDFITWKENKEEDI